MGFASKSAYQLVEALGESQKRSLRERGQYNVTAVQSHLVIILCSVFRLFDLLLFQRPQLEDKVEDEIENKRHTFKKTIRKTIRTGLTSYDRSDLFVKKKPKTQSSGKTNGYPLC